jgi:hypothetical protein
MTMATRHNQLTKLILVASFALLVSTSAAAFAGVAVGIGINVGVAPPPPPAEVVVPGPHPGFVWVAGHYDWFAGAGYRWVAGSWIRPPYPRAVWVAPHYYYGPRGRIFYRGYWRR